MRSSGSDTLTKARADLNAARQHYRGCKAQVANAKVSWKMVEIYYPSLYSTWASVHGRWLAHCRVAKKKLRAEIQRTRGLLEAINGT